MFGKKTQIALDLIVLLQEANTSEFCNKLFWVFDPSIQIYFSYQILTLTKVLIIVSPLSQILVQYKDLDLKDLRIFKLS